MKARQRAGDQALSPAEFDFNTAESVANYTFGFATLRTHMERTFLDGPLWRAFTLVALAWLLIGMCMFSLQWMGLNPHHRTSEQLVNELLITAAITPVACLWVCYWGGVSHLVSRKFGSTAGFGMTLRAVAYALSVGFAIGSFGFFVPLVGLVGAVLGTVLLVKVLMSQHGLRPVPAIVSALVPLPLVYALTIVHMGLAL